MVEHSQEWELQHFPYVKKRALEYLKWLEVHQYNQGYIEKMRVEKWRHIADLKAKLQIQRKRVTDDGIKDSVRFAVLMQEKKAFNIK